MVSKNRSGGTNEGAEFTLMYRGSGKSIDIFYPEEGITRTFDSPSDTRYLWTETKSERIVLEKKDSDLHWKVIDFTDYSGALTPLSYTTL